MDPRKQDAVKRYRANESVASIVKHMGISTMTLYTWLADAGIKQRNRPAQPRGGLLVGPKLKRAVSLYRKPMGLLRVAKRMGTTIFLLRRSFRGKIQLRHCTSVLGKGKKSRTELRMCVLQMLAKNMSYAAIAKKLGYTRAHIYRAVPVRRDEKWKEKRHQIIAHYKRYEFVSIAQTAADCGCSEEMVRETIDEAKLPRHQRVSKFYKLVPEARRLYDSGMGMHAVSERLKMSEGAVAHVVQARSRSQAFALVWDRRKKAG